MILDRWSVVHFMSCKDTQHRWIAGKLVGNVIWNDMQILVVRSDQELSTMDVKSALAMKSSSVEMSIRYYFF